MAKDPAQRLMEMKQEIEATKISKAQIEGSLKNEMERLKSEFGVSSLEKAKRKLDEYRLAKKEIEQEMEKIVAGLEKDYDWN